MPRHWAESLAWQHLEAMGYTLLEQNYTLRGAEIDLIAQQADTIVFVEVKQRKNDRYGSAAEAIHAAKLKRLQKAALHYLVTRYGHAELMVRFDAVLISGSAKNHRLEHLKGIL